MRGAWAAGLWMAMVGATWLASPASARDPEHPALVLKVEESRRWVVSPPLALVVELETSPGTRYGLWAAQRGVDVGLELFTGFPDTEPKRVDAPLDRRGQEFLWIPASEEPAPRLYLRVTPLERLAPPGEVELRLEKMAVEDPRAVALASWSSAGENYARKDEDPQRQALALDQFRAAAEQLRPFDTGAALQARYCVAVLHRLLNQSDQALAAAEALVPDWKIRAEGNDAEANSARSFLAATLNELGLLRWQLGDPTAAIPEFQAAAAAAGQAGDEAARVAAGANLCLMSLVRGKVRDGLSCYQEILPAMGILPSEQQTAWLNVGRAEDVLGEPERAAQAYQRGLELALKLEDQLGVARLHNNLGVLARQLGEFETALDHYERALQLFEHFGEQRWRARVLGNLGVLYGELADSERGRYYLETALTAWRQVGDPAGEAVALAQLGRVAEGEGDFARAIALFGQALDLDRQGERRLAEALDLSNLGAAKTRVGLIEEALVALERARELLASEGESGPLASVFCRMGRAELASSRLERATASFERALDLGRETGWPGDIVCAQLGLAETAQTRGDLPKALEWVEAALATVNGVRRELIAPELRATFSGLERQGRELEVALWVARHRAEPTGGFADRALEASERAKARTLSELLVEARVGQAGALRAGSVPTEPDPEPTRALRLALARLAAKAARLRVAKGEEQTTLAAEIAELEREIDRREREMRLANPAWATLKEPPPFRADTQRVALGQGVALLSYFLGEKQSYVWLGDQYSLEVFDLPPRREIEIAARNYAEALSRGRGEPLDPNLAPQLARLILAPLGPLPLVETWVIVPDGALAFVPFATLPFQNDRPWMEFAASVQLPSLQAWALLRDQAARRAPAERPLVVFSDPVFSRDDPRVVGTTSAIDPGEGAVRGPRPGGQPESRLAEQRWPRLPGTRIEAEQVLASLPADDGASALWLDGFAANREAVLEDHLRDFRVLHFATHGDIDSRRPALSNLRLSESTEEGKAIEGRLTLHDVYGLQLAADLVVLSGCRTALGKEVRAEGLIGLVRGFFYAGALRVMASLWPVEDRATAELMRRFYRAYWGEKLPPAEALRRAQQEMAADRRFRDPRLWGAFVLAGVR